MKVCVEQFTWLPILEFDLLHPNVVAILSISCKRAPPYNNIRLMI